MLVQQRLEFHVESACTDNTHSAHFGCIQTVSGIAGIDGCRHHHVCGNAEHDGHRSTDDSPSLKSEGESIVNLECEASEI